MKNKLLKGTEFGILFSLPLWALIITIAFISITWMQGSGKPANVVFTGKPAAPPSVRAALQSPPKLAAKPPQCIYK